MHGPVGPALGVLAGPVQRVDDPDPSGRVGQLRRPGRPPRTAPGPPGTARPAGRAAARGSAGRPRRRAALPSRSPSWSSRSTWPARWASSAAAACVVPGRIGPAVPFRPRPWHSPVAVPGTGLGPGDSLHEPGPGVGRRSARAAAACVATILPSCRHHPPWTSPSSRRSSTPPSRTTCPTCRGDQRHRGPHAAGRRRVERPARWHRLGPVADGAGRLRGVAGRRGPDRPGGAGRHHQPPHRLPAQAGPGRRGGRRPRCSSSGRGSAWSTWPSTRWPTTPWWPRPRSHIRSRPLS